MQLWSQVVGLVEKAKTNVDLTGRIELRRTEQPHDDGDGDSVDRSKDKGKQRHHQKRGAEARVSVDHAADEPDQRGIEQFGIPDVSPDVGEAFKHLTSTP